MPNFMYRTLLTLVTFLFVTTAADFSNTKAESYLLCALGRKPGTDPPEPEREVISNIQTSSRLAPILPPVAIPD